MDGSSFVLTQHEDMFGFFDLAPSHDIGKITPGAVLGNRYSSNPTKRWINVHRREEGLGLVAVRGNPWITDNEGHPAAFFIWNTLAHQALRSHHFAVVGGIHNDCVFRLAGFLQRL